MSGYYTYSVPLPAVAGGTKVYYRPLRDLLQSVAIPLLLFGVSRWSYMKIPQISPIFSISGLGMSVATTGVATLSPAIGDMTAVAGIENDPAPGARG